MDDVKVIGQRLRKLRGARSLEVVVGDVERLYAVKMTRQTLELYEEGRVKQPSATKLGALAALFDVSTDYLLSGREAQRRRVGRG